MVLATDLVVLDHFEGSAMLVANAILPAEADQGRRVAPRTTRRSAGWTR